MLSSQEMEKWNEFQRIWTVEKVENMTLEEYHKAGAKEKCFAWWIEFGLRFLGEIRGRESIKYGIYNKSKNKSEVSRENASLYDKDGYVWYKKYGETKKIAFENIKNSISQIIKCIQNDKIEEIDDIDCGWNTYKWKIAFCYQKDIKNPQITPIYEEEVLRKIVEKECKKDPKEMTIAQLHRAIIDKKPLGKDIFDWDLWKKYGYKKMDDNALSSDENNSGEKTFPLNQILYGPPGTGKTYHAVDKALEILGYDDVKILEDRKKIFEKFMEKGQIVFVTFHQNYGYEEFIEGIKPISKNGNMIYKIKDGIFKALCNKAKDKTNNRYILIIDEINRGNISKIFGELITLIERSKRIGEPEGLNLTLPYSGDFFGVPSNLYIIGTMNTADRSITLMDTALRRRFDFIEMMPDKEEIDRDLEDQKINLAAMLEAINSRIEFLYDREHTIGHTFFIDVKDLDDLKRVFQTKIIPLLQEYFYEDYAKINAVLNNNKMIKENKAKCEEIFSHSEAIKNLDLGDRDNYKIAEFNDTIWGDTSTYQKIIGNKKPEENDPSK